MANTIKYIAKKTSASAYTQVPIGVDSVNVDRAGGKTVETSLTNIEDNIGNLTNLQTTSNTDLVTAINEVNAKPSVSTAEDVTYGESNVKVTLDNHSSQLADNTNKTETTINVKYPPKSIVGARGDGIVDDTQAIKNIMDTLNDGDTLYFPRGVYLITEEIYIDKYIKISGDSLFTNNGTILKFDGCSGIIARKPYLQFENITINGVNKPDVSIVDIPNRVFGTIGFKCNYGTDTVQTSSGIRCNNVSITGFNIGLAMYQEGTATWSGAYREFTTCLITYNDIGVIALDGATHNKFYGGVINANAIHGIYADIENTVYNELEFIGTTIEGNGTTALTSTTTEAEYSKIGIYAGNSSSLKFTNCYFELIIIFANTGGKVVLNSCHVHWNCYMYAKGSIIDNNSLANYSIKKGYNSALLDNLTLGSCEGIDVASSNPHVKITSSSAGVVKATLSATLIKNILAKNIKRVKFSFDAKVNSGLTATGFGIFGKLNINASDGSTDSMTFGRTFPMAVLQPKSLGEYEHFEYYWYPRITAGYINPDALLNYFACTFYFSSASNFQADYTTNNLDIEIMNPITTIYSDVDFIL